MNLDLLLFRTRKINKATLRRPVFTIFFAFFTMALYFGSFIALFNEQIELFRPEDLVKELPDDPVVGFMVYPFLIWAILVAVAIYALIQVKTTLYGKIHYYTIVVDLATMLIFFKCRWNIEPEITDMFGVNGTIAVGVIMLLMLFFMLENFLTGFLAVPRFGTNKEGSFWKAPYFVTLVVGGLSSIFGVIMLVITLNSIGTDKFKMFYLMLSLLIIVRFVYKFSAVNWLITPYKKEYMQKYEK